MVRCLWKEENKEVAIKSIKNKESYRQLAMKQEIQILEELNEAEMNKGTNKIIRKLEHFEFSGHLFLVFELLDISLYDLLRETRFNGLTLEIIRGVSRQILEGLEFLHEKGIVHSDIKPENVLFSDGHDDKLKIIDFGSSFKSGSPFFDKVQTLHYRAPEVIIGAPFDLEIDMWSFGCLVAELYIGLPLFHGASDYEQLHRIIGACGMPTPTMVHQGKHHAKYFSFGKHGHLALKTPEQFARDNKCFVEPQKFWHPVKEFSDFEAFYESSKVRETAQPQEKLEVEMFVDFLEKVLRVVPKERMTATEALRHPFIANDLKGFIEIKRKKSLSSRTINLKLEDFHTMIEMAERSPFDSPWFRSSWTPADEISSPVKSTLKCKETSHASVLTACSGCTVESLLLPPRYLKRSLSLGEKRKRQGIAKLYQK